MVVVVAVVMQTMIKMTVTDDELMIVTIIPFCSCVQVSSAEFERACMASGMPGVHEVAAVGVSASGGGPEALVLCCVLSGGKRGGGDDLKFLFTKALKERLNPLFKVGAIGCRSSIHCRYCHPLPFPAAFADDDDGRASAGSGCICSMKATITDMHGFSGIPLPPLLLLLLQVSKVVTVDVLPRTASNKVMRRVLRDQLMESSASAAKQRSKL